MIAVIIDTDHYAVTVEDDGSVIEQRSGEIGRRYPSLQEYYMSLNSATKRWGTHCLDNILEPGARVIDGLLTAQRLAQVAAAEIEATAPGEIVPGTAMTREEADQLMALAAHVLAFVNAPVVEGGETVSQIISRYR
jgi:hypothetical protein